MMEHKSHSNGKVVVVTGASSGLGWATALAFSECGSHVIATARREDRLAELKVRTGCDILAGDASEAATSEAIVRLALEKYGRIDILINNAGLGNYKQLVDTSVEEYDELMRANMRSSFIFSRAVAPCMIAQRSGLLFFVASVAGVTGTANESVYCATKFAQVGFAQALDQELSVHGIKSSALIVGGMKTEFALGKGRDAASVAASAMMDPGEVAESILHICSQPENIRIPLITVRHMGVRG